MMTHQTYIFRKLIQILDLFSFTSVKDNMTLMASLLPIKWLGIKNTYSSKFRTRWWCGYHKSLPFEMFHETKSGFIHCSFRWNSTKKMGVQVIIKSYISCSIWYLQEYIKTNINMVVVLLISCITWEI